MTVEARESLQADQSPALRGLDIAPAVPLWGDAEPSEERYHEWGDGEGR